MTVPNPCFHCANGNPAKCTAVDCYQCNCGCRTRRHGVRSTEHPVDSRKPGKRLSTLRIDP